MSVLTERVKALLLPTRVYVNSALRGFEGALVETELEVPRRGPRVL
ncbi:MAG: hypothetical protein ACO2OR_03695 [Desulfurococcaceae archaeon]